MFESSCWHSNTHNRNMTVTFDSLEQHITNISRTPYYHLHRIGCIRLYLDQRHTKQPVHAPVMSHIDCSKSLLNGLSVAVIEKLKRIHNTYAHIMLIR